MREELNYFDVRKMSVEYRANVMTTRAKSMFEKFKTKDIKEILYKLSCVDTINHPELDKINEYLLQLEGMKKPETERTNPNDLSNLKKLAGDNEKEMGS
ncbi:MAG: hypothetical protein ACW99G_06065 [Candidatus Thorarchaeota archaeon]|jgi:hypothetical protein